MTFIIFWASLFAVVFFLLGAIFKSIASLTKALVVASAYIVLITLGVGVTIVILYALYIIVYGIANGLIGEVIEVFVLMIVVGGFVGALFYGAGVLALQLLRGIIATVEGVLQWISNVMEFWAAKCEQAYEFFLHIITKQIKKN